MALPLALQAQTYQPLNAGFEQWDGTSSTAEPTHWNSFASSDGSYASLASSPHHYHRYGGRPGSTGSSYLTIYTKSIMGIKANGNMTTGRIHAGSMSAASSDNYNYTQRSNSDFSQAFTATPDSMYVWVSYYAKTASSEASITATIHGDNDFRDPNDLGTASKYAGCAKLEFTRTTTHPVLPEWQLKKVPVVYSGTAAPAYLLISLTTNKTPGSGDANDSLMVDDIYFVYSSWLTDIRLNGATLDGFSKGHLDYSAHVGSFDSVDISYTVEVNDAVVTVAWDSISDTVRLYTLTVTAEDGVTQHVYSLEVTSDASGQGGEGDDDDDDDDDDDEGDDDDDDDNDDDEGINVATGMHLMVSPNPSDGRFQVSVEGTQLRQVELFDLEGRCYGQWSVNDGQLDVSALPAGTYVVRVITTQGKVISTSVVKR